MPESIWSSSLRSLLKTFCSIIGIFLALLLIILFYNEVDTSEDTITNNYTFDIVPNAEGVRTKLSKSAPVILQIEIQGALGTLEATHRNIERMLVESREGGLKNDRVKGILLVLNTPGGTINDADGIYQSLLEYKARHKVPVYAFVDGLCASGGMYIICAADQVLASDVSLIGSVGVLTNPFLNFTKLMDKVGVDALSLSVGKGKDALNPLRPWKPDEDKNIKEILNYYYLSFVDLVTKHRPQIDRNKLINEYGAQIYPAAKAAEIGFIDHAGETRNSALKKLVAKLGIEDDYYQVVKMESSNWYHQLISAQSPLLTGKIKHELLLDKDVPEAFQQSPLLLYRQ